MNEACPEYLQDILQTLQNRAAQLVTKSSWYSASATVVHATSGWLAKCKANGSILLINPLVHDKTE